jgi:hypothetical protein
MLGWNQNTLLGDAVDGRLLVSALQVACNKLKLGITRKQENAPLLPSVLSYSFSTLDEAEQSMFLDVATVFHGLPKEVAVAVWNELFKRNILVNVTGCLENMEQRCLVDSSGGSLRMHDVIRYLGRSICLNNTSITGADIAGKYAGTRLFVSNTSFMDGSQDSLDWLEEQDSSAPASLQVYGEQEVS